MNSDNRLQDAVAAWRESLVMLSGRNRLLNYRPTKSSTLEFARASTDEILTLVAESRGVPVMGTVPAAALVTGFIDEIDASADLETRALEVVEDYDFSAFTGHLFVTKTQREVDRALKNLSSTASREYLDRGLTVLYLALGALHWTELNGDARVSPLVFLPVDLKSDGPRQPPRLYSSEGDLVVNPALDIRVRDYGLSLPDQATIEVLMAEGGMAAVESAIGALALPDGWRVEPMCVLSAFMFAKEAMFRDLETHEGAVLASPVVQALAGASDHARDRMLFAPDSADEVDELAPPETAALILDADSSQRVAVAAAAAGKSFVLDGPPGTGKSQTIANIIATLVSSGKKVLFVSEKAVALDVVRDRLTGRGLGPLLFELHSHKATRAEVAKSLGAALSEKPSIVQRSSAAQLSRAKKMRTGLSEYAAAMNEVRSPIGWTLHDAIGALASLPEVADLPAARLKVEGFTAEQWNELQDLVREVAASWGHLVQGERHVWHGLRSAEGLSYDVSEAARMRQNLIEALDTVAPRRADLSLDGTDSWRDLEALSNYLQSSQPDWIDPVWLVEAPNETLELGLALRPRVLASITEDEQLSEIVGSHWRLLRDSLPVPATSSNMTSLFGDVENDSIAAVKASLGRVAAWARELDVANARITEIARNVGLPAPRYLGDLRAATGIVQSLSEIDGLRPAWLTRDGLDSLVNALDALEISQQAAAAAESDALASFKPTISEVDVAPIQARWQSLPRWRRAVFGPSADDRRVVSAHSSLKPRAAAAATDAALAWQVARGDLGTKSAAAESVLGFAPVGVDQWMRAHAVVEKCRQIHQRNLKFDVEQLGETMSNNYAWRAVVREAAEAGSQLSEASVLVSGVGFADDSREVRSLLQQIHSVGADLEATLDAAESYADGGTRSLHIARDIQVRVATSASEADHVERDVSSVVRELRADHGALTSVWVASMEKRLTWSMEFRNRTPLEHRERSLEVYREMAWSPSLVPAGEQWVAASSRLMDRFDHQRYAGPLGDEADSGEVLESLRVQLDDAETLIRAAKAASALKENGLDLVLGALLAQAEDERVVEQRLRAAVLRAWVEGVMRDDRRLINDYAYTTRESIADQFRELDREIVDHAAATVLANAVSRRPTAPSRQTALILGEASKKRRHIPVRELIARATEVIQSVHPCFMMSPLAVSQFLPSEIKFDVVIFDEASQVPPGDAINCLYRADAVIAAGDQKQLPPTAFFSSSQTENEEDSDDDLANDYESLLDLMKGSGAFTSISLLWHYRSKHEHLIAYSTIIRSTKTD